MNGLDGIQGCTLLGHTLSLPLIVTIVSFFIHFLGHMFHYYF